jgi:hypothetical protein
MTIAASAADMQKLDQRIEAAHQVLHELTATPDKGIPDDIAPRQPASPSFPASKREPSSSADNPTQSPKSIRHRRCNSDS